MWKALAAVALGLLAAGEARAAPFGALVPELSVVSDYRYDGLSNSDRHAVVQGSLYLWRPDGIYAGLFATGVDFNFARSASWELDVYGGRSFDLGKTRATAEVMATLFPDHSAPGPSFDFVQAKGKLRRSDGPVTLGAEVAWTPDAAAGAGEAWRVTGEATYAARPWLTLGGKLGRWTPEHGQERTFWDAGVKATWKTLAFDLRYVGTDLERPQCFHTDWCEPAAIAKVTWTAPYIRLGR